MSEQIVKIIKSHGPIHRIDILRHYNAHHPSITVHHLEDILEQLAKDEVIYVMQGEFQHGSSQLLYIIQKHPH